MRAPKRYETAVGERWRLRYRRGSEETSETFDTEEDALVFALHLKQYGWERAETLLYDRLATDVKDELTLNAWVEQYISTRTKANPGTKQKYRNNWERSFGPEIGSLPLRRVGPDDVAKVIIELSDVRGYADKTIANYHGLLAGAMKVAHRRGMIEVNPCAETELPERTSHESDEAMFLTEEEYEALRSSFAEHFWPLLDTVAGTGIRWGEAEALLVRDFDRKSKTLKITKAVKYHPKPSMRKVGPPKTKQSRRTITLPDPVVVILAHHVKDKAQGDLLFTMPKGGALWHRTFWSRYWVKACVAAGLTDPRPKFHSLRHSHAAWLISRGVPLTVIQRRLGHSSIKVTSDLYGHLLPDVRQAEADAAGQVFLGIRSQVQLEAG